MCFISGTLALRTLAYVNNAFPAQNEGEAQRKMLSSSAMTSLERQECLSNAMEKNMPFGSHINLRYFHHRKTVPWRAIGQSMKLRIWSVFICLSTCPFPVRESHWNPAHFQKSSGGTHPGKCPHEKSPLQMKKAMQELKPMTRVFMKCWFKQAIYGSKPSKWPPK